MSGMGMEKCILNKAFHYEGNIKETKQYLTMI
jgi:hypothetical protein